jgi:hypothetical protein
VKISSVIGSSILLFSFPVVAPAEAGSRAAAPDPATLDSRFREKDGVKLSKRQAAIDDDRLAGDKAASARREHQRDAGDVFGFAEAS